MSIVEKLLHKPEAFSIQELQRGVQDGSVPAYIGVPLIQDKMKQMKEAQNLQAAGANPNPPTVAQNILAQANGISSLPSNLPVTTGAGGGIVAFTAGGEADDEEEDDSSEETGMNKEERMLFQKLSGGQEEMPEPELAEESEGAEGIEGLAGMAGVAARNASHALKTDINKTSEEQKDALLKHVLHKESRGQRYDKEGKLLTSPKGAMGEMQVMPGTARSPGLGVEPARSNSPEEFARVGRDYLHALHNRYGSNELAAIAYNWGPGNTDKWLASGAEMSKLPKETRDYIKDVPRGAQGGEVHFAEGSKDAVVGVGSGKHKISTTSGNDFLNWLIPAYPAAPADNGGYPSDVDISRPYIGNPNIAAQGKKAGAVQANPSISNAPRTPPAHPEYNAAADSQKASVATPNYDTTTEAEDQSFGTLQRTPMEANAPAQTAETADVNDPYKAFADYLDKRQKGIEQNYNNDKYMALLQAGLGMMGGTSPFAAANIGQGASQGVAYMANANRQRAAEENALMSGKLGLTRADLYNKMHQAQLQQHAQTFAAQQQFRYDQLRALVGDKEARRILDQQKIQEQGRANDIRGAQAMQKAATAFEGSPTDIALQEEAKRRSGKNWRQDAKTNSWYEQSKKLKIKDLSFMNMGDDDIKSSSEY